MDESKLEKELREKLPPDHINVDPERMVAWYYDYHAVTYRDSEEEQKIADRYVNSVISEKAGCPIRIKDEYDGNGHVTVHYEKIED